MRPSHHLDHKVNNVCKPLTAIHKHKQTKHKQTFFRTAVYMCTYINQVLCPENFCDFISQQVLLGSSESIYVHLLNHNLNKQEGRTLIGAS